MIKKIVLLIIAFAITLGLFWGMRKGIISEADQMNLLVMGIDTPSGLKARSDSLNFVHIDFSKKRIGILSIPRDTYVDIPGHGRDKINHAHMFGGPDLTCRTVSRFLGIPVNYYIEANFPMFINLIDQIGGIDIDVEKPLYYDDYAADLHVRLKPGPQKLSGYNAMGYVRFRHDFRSDWGRIDRQHKFFDALSKGLLSPLNIARFPYILYTASSNIKTNLGFVQATKIGMKVSSIFRHGNVEYGVIPGGDAQISGGYYMMPDREGMKKEVDRVIYGRK